MTSVDINAGFTLLASQNDHIEDGHATINNMKLSKENPFTYTISHGPETIRNLEVKFDLEKVRSSLSPYKVLGECRTTFNSLIFNTISGQGLLMYDSVLRPDIVPYNIEEKRLLLPFSDHHEMRMCALPYMDGKIHFNIRDKLELQRISTYNIAKNLAFINKKNVNLNHLPVELIEKIAEEATITYEKYEPNESILQAQGSYTLLTHRNRQALTVQQEICPYIQYNEIELLMYNSLIENEVVIFDLRFNLPVIGFLFAFFDEGQNLVDCLDTYSFMIGDTFINIGNRADALIYNKAKYNLQIARDIKELPVGALFFGKPTLNMEDLEKGCFVTSHCSSQLILKLNLEKETPHSVRCLAICYNKIRYTGGTCGLI